MDGKRCDEKLIFSISIGVGLIPPLLNPTPIEMTLKIKYEKNN